MMTHKHLHDYYPFSKSSCKGNCDTAINLNIGISNSHVPHVFVYVYIMFGENIYLNTSN